MYLAAGPTGKRYLLAPGKGLGTYTTNHLGTFKQVSGTSLAASDKYVFVGSNYLSLYNPSSLDFVDRDYIGENLDLILPLNNGGVMASSNGQTGTFGFDRFGEYDSLYYVGGVGGKTYAQFFTGVNWTQFNCADRRDRGTAVAITSKEANGNIYAWNWGFETPQNKRLIVAGKGVLAYAYDPLFADLHVELLQDVDPSAGRLQLIQTVALYSHRKLALVATQASVIRL